MKKKIGLIAGRGNFPLILCRNAQLEGYQVYVVAIKEEASPELEALAHKVKWLSVGQLKRAILFFKWHRVKELVLAGKVIKTQIFQNPSMDEALSDVFQNVPNKKDDTLLKGIVDKVEKLGFRFLDSTQFLQTELATAGALTTHQPSAEQQEDILFGFELAKASGGLDIGQSVVVKNQAILAVEAIEGTDQAIKRGASLGGEGVVVVKVSKPNQDMRFDVPVVGEETIQTLIDQKAKVLAVEANKTLILNKEKTIAMAEKAGLVFVGIVGEGHV